MEDFEVEVPEGWSVRRLGELGELKTSGIDKLTRENEINVKLVNYMDVYKMNYINSNMDFQIVTTTQNKIEKCNLLKGDILITPSSETPDDAGHVSVVMEDLFNTVYSYHLVRFRAHKEYKLDLNYSKYIFSTHNAIEYLYKSCKGSTRFTISLKDFQNIPILLPPLAEQKKIGEVLSLMDEHIQELQTIISLKHKLKKALMQDLLKGTDENGDILQGWELRTLGEFLEEVSIRNKDIENNIILSVNNKLGFISQEEQFENHRVASKEVDNYKIVYKNYYGYNPSRINVGSLARLKNYDSGIVSPMYIVFKADEKNIDLNFLDSYFKTFNFQELVKNNTVGSVRDSLNFKSLIKFPILLPPLDEQKKIGEALSLLDQHIQDLNSQLAHNHNLKKALMQDLLSGKVRFSEV